MMGLGIDNCPLGDLIAVELSDMFLIQFKQLYHCEVVRPFYYVNMVDVSLFNFSVLHPGTGEEIKPVSLLSIEGLHRIILNLVTNFTSFAPLGTVLVSLLGIAVAEHSGLIGTALRLLVLKAPKKLLTFVIVFAGILSNNNNEAGLEKIASRLDQMALRFMTEKEKELIRP